VLGNKAVVGTEVVGVVGIAVVVEMVVVAAAAVVVVVVVGKVAAVDLGMEIVVVG